MSSDSSWTISQEMRGVLAGTAIRPLSIPNMIIVDWALVRTFKYQTVVGSDPLEI